MSRTWLPKAAIITIRLLPLSAVAVVLPLVLNVLTGRPGAAAVLHERSADILGTAALFCLVGAFAVTPVRTVTGWGWHLILGRDLGLWTAAFAFADVGLAAGLAEGGWAAGLLGEATLVAGTAAALLLVPLALTSNRLSMRRLGRNWKRLHQLVYPVIAAVALHLYFLEGVRGLIEAALLFGPLIALRLPPVRRRVAGWRKRRAHIKECASTSSPVREQEACSCAPRRRTRRARAEQLHSEWTP